MKLCEKCKTEPAIVGLGKKWLCLKCFEDGLKMHNEIAHKMADMLRNAK